MGFKVVVVMVRLFPIYFPQFHRLPENDVNFYAGATDMTNLAHWWWEGKETPHESLLPYDLIENPSLIPAQIDLLCRYKLDGFAMYYYWFSENTVTGRRRIMEKVHDAFLDADLRGRHIFYIWANEDWSGNPAFGGNGHVIRNLYTPENIELLAADLVVDFLRPNYLKIDGRPLFFVHHSWLLKADELSRLRTVLDRVCAENGLVGVYFRTNNLMSTALGEPVDYASTYTMHPNYKMDRVPHTRGYVFDYRTVVDKMDPCPIKTVYFDFDNRARLSKPDRLALSTVCVDNTPAMQERFLANLKSWYDANANDDGILLINAWNEWGERMHVEPSAQRGTALLDLIARVFFGVP